MRKSIAIISLFLTIFVFIHIKNIDAASSTYFSLSFDPESQVPVSTTVEIWARLFSSSGPVIGKTYKFYVDGVYLNQGKNVATGWVYVPFTPTSARDYKIKVVFEGDSTYSASYKESTLTVTASIDDADIYSFTSPSGTYYLGDPATATVKIENTGTTTRYFWVGLSYWDSNGHREDVPAQESSSLSPGGKATLTFNWDIPDGLATGWCSITTAVYDNSALSDPSLDYEDAENAFQIAKDDDGDIAINNIQVYDYITNSLISSELTAGHPFNILFQIENMKSIDINSQINLDLFIDNELYQTVIIESLQSNEILVLSVYWLTFSYVTFTLMTASASL